MIVFKGGGGGGGLATTINQTGLGDDQYQTIQTNQSDIRSDIGTLNTDVTSYGDTLTTGQSGITNLIGSAASTDDEGIVTPATGLYGQFGDQYNYLTGLSDRMDTGFTDLSGNVNTQTSALAAGQSGLAAGQSGLAAGQSGLVTGLGNLQDNVNTGLAGFTGRFDNIDQANTNMQTSVDEGFQDQAKGFETVNSNMATGFSENSTAMNTGFAEAAAALDTGFSDASTELTNTQANVLTGQQSLGNQLDTIDATADAYASQSLENQEALQTGQEGFVSKFDDYVDRYSDDTKLAQDTRTDMQTANANANQALRNDMAKTAYTEEVKANDLARNVQALKIGQAKTAAAAAVNNPNLDQSMRQNFSNLTNSFDANGELIPTSTDRSGNRIVRSMDGQGNITLNSFNSLGQPIGSQSLNLARSLDVLSQVSNKLSNQMLEAMRLHSCKQGNQCIQITYHKTV